MAAFFRQGRDAIFWRRRSCALLTVAFATVGIATAQAETPAVVSMPGAPTLGLGSYDLGDLGYSVAEYSLSGTARSYRLEGGASSDGNWKAVRDGSAPYRTRIVVVRPANVRAFNGTVIVEWLNVSGGLDVPVDWMTTHRELIRSGYAYVAVSAQKVGIDGGASLVRSGVPALKKANPERYNTLEHPGDAYSFDIFSDVARVLKSSSGSLVLGGLHARRVLGIGESQSAFYMATYVNAVDPLVHLYDGFMIHSRSGVAAPLDGRPVIGVPPEQLVGPVQLRSPLRVPVMQVITETDLMGLVGTIGFYASRQPDADHLRTWEIAGTAHADNYLFRVGAIDTGHLSIDQLAAAWAPLNKMQGVALPQAVNNAPQHHYVVQAALSALDRWVERGTPPPTAPRLALTAGATPAFARDAQGLAQGGVRTPWIDVPVGVTTGAGVALLGATQPFDAAALDRMYPDGRSEYLTKFTKALDRTIAAGFLLPADRAEIIALADNGYHGSH